MVIFRSKCEKLFHSEREICLKVRCQALMSSTQVQSRSFDVIDSARIVFKYTNEIVHAKRAKLLFFVDKYANLWHSCRHRLRGCLRSLIINTFILSVGIPEKILIFLDGGSQGSIIKRLSTAYWKRSEFVDKSLKILTCIHLKPNIIKPYIIIHLVSAGTVICRKS